MGQGRKSKAASHSVQASGEGAMATGGGNVTASYQEDKIYFWLIRINPIVHQVASVGAHVSIRKGKAYLSGERLGNVPPAHVKRLSDFGNVTGIIVDLKSEPSPKAQIMVEF